MEVIAAPPDLLYDSYKSMTHAGARPMQILAAIQTEDQDTLVSAIDIRSERKAIRKKHLNGKSPMETLLDNYLRVNTH